MHLDFGTGDGAFVVRSARADPTTLFLGVDAAAEPMREHARKAPANALFGVLPLASAPGALEGLAQSLTVLLPWGSLLTAVATAQVAPLRGLTANARFVFGYGPRDGVGLPPLDLATLEAGYAAAGFDLKARFITKDDVRALRTTWAGRLAFSGIERRFVELAPRVDGSARAKGPNGLDGEERQRGRQEGDVDAAREGRRALGPHLAQPHGHVDDGEDGQEPAAHAVSASGS